MNGRFLVALAVAGVLIFGVTFGQIKLNRVAEDLAAQSDTVCEAFGREETAVGLQALDRLTSSFTEKKSFLLFFANDARVHEILRSLERARRLAEENDLSPALEALSDFSSSLRELSRTHVPTLGNIF